MFVVFRTKAASGDRLASVEARGDWTLSSDAQGRAVVSASTNISGTAVFVSGKRAALRVETGGGNCGRGPVAGGPRARRWREPGKLSLPALKSLSESDDAAVKYFSGTATYRAQSTWTPPCSARANAWSWIWAKCVIWSRVKVNGQSLGVLWHPPFVRDITSALKPGENTLELAVANTWHNRLVGDEQFPPDFEFGTDRGADKGRALKAYPDWFIKGEPRPEPGRKGFVVWYYHRKDTPLMPAGLLGPVRLIPRAETALAP